MDYGKLAREVREKILKGEFEPKTVRDFIAYLYAYFEFEDVPEIDFDEISVIFY